MSQAPERLHALDAVRAWALLAGLALHASLSFFAGIPATDNSPSTALALLFFVIHMFRMSLFFLLAGFFAGLLLERRGWRGFIGNRARRILLPMLVFWIVLLPLTLVPLLWGLSRSGNNGEMLEILARESGAGVPLLHLWFLYYLLLFYALALLLHWGRLNSTAFAVLQRRATSAALALLNSGFATLLLALPVAAALLQHAGWNAWLGIPTHMRGLRPWPILLLCHGMAFLCGWLAHRHRGLLRGWEQTCWRHLAVAAICTLLCLLLAGPEPQLETPRYFAGRPGAGLIYTLAYALGLWSWCFGVTGWALRHASGFSALIRELADASYWMYLMHLPLVFTLQVLLMDLPLHWSLKYPLILALSCALLLWSYRRWIRRGPIGRMLNGRADTLPS